ncbi:MAG: DUF3775 domain-containing protein [Methylovirgula sp.]
MLTHLSQDQARFIALLAKAARTQRDMFLGNVAEADLGGTMPARGEHNPTAELGFEPLPPDAEQLSHLRTAIAALKPEARVELYTLMRIGQGDLAAEKWHRGVSEAEFLGEATMTAALMGDADLHDHIDKGLYESEAA